MRGSAAAALYDLRSARIQRLNAAVLDVVDAACSSSDKESEYHPDVVCSLIERGFLKKCASEISTYIADRITTPLPVLRSISFDLFGSERPSVEQVASLIHHAEFRYGLINCVLVFERFDNDAPRFVEECLAATSLVFIEIWSMHADSESLRRFVKSCAARQRIVLRSLRTGSPVTNYRQRGPSQRTIACIDAPVSSHSLIVNNLFFWNARLKSESFGCLHFSRNGKIYPDISEKWYSVSNWPLATNDLDVLLMDGSLARYWSLSKDGRGKCADCELRYACPNPIGARSIPEDLSSPPANCNYQLDTGRWI